jgi:hypothetical protein
MGRPVSLESWAPEYPKAIPDDLGGKEPSLWIIGGQEFDDAEPVLLILPVRLEIVFALRFQDRRSPCSTVLVQNSRYTDDTHSVGSDTATARTTFSNNALTGWHALNARSTCQSVLRRLS